MSFQIGRYISAAYERISRIRLLRRITHKTSADSQPESAPLDAVRHPMPEHGKDGAFYHLGDILDQLPDLFNAIRQMRSVDRSAYDFHRQVGARIAADTTIMSGNMGRDFLNKMPAAGMVAFPRKFDGPETITPSLQYFEKRARIIPKVECARAGEVVYKYVAVFLASSGGNVSAFPIRAHLAITHDGDVRILRERESQSDWKVPPRLSGWYNDRKWRGDTDARNVHQFVATCFALCVNCWRSTLDEYQVRTTTAAGISAAFSVSIGRTPYFFKDRQTAAASDGKRKRIFHQVAEHERRMSDGSTRTIKSHFRGERQFDWHGYRINISVPGVHHAPIQDFGAETYGMETDDIPNDMIGLDEAGAAIAEHMGGAAQ